MKDETKQKKFTKGHLQETYSCILLRLKDFSSLFSDG